MFNKTVILHIGLPKTGTSYLQNTLFERQDQLEVQDVHYLSAYHPEIFHDYGHHVLAIALMDHIEGDLDPAEVEAAWPAALSEIEATPQRHIVISSEWFSFGIHSQDKLRQLADLLSGHEVRIALGLRDVVDLTNSLYAQGVRSGGTKSISQFIKDSWPLLDWAALADRWATVFGTDNVIAMDFDIARGSNLAATFLAYTVGPSVSVDVGSRNHNVTLPLHATEMLREINSSAIDPQIKAEFREAVKAFYERADYPFAPGRYLGEDAAAMLRMRCQWPHVVNRPT